jgi:uncharacterized membrane protein
MTQRRQFDATALARLTISALSRDSATAVLLIVDVTELVLVAAGVGGTVRFVAGMVTGLAVPGWALVSHLDLRWPAAEIALSLAGSLAVLLLVAQLMVITRQWHPAAATWAVGAVAAVALVARLVRSGRRRVPVRQ